jgi:outer membrane lipoprotein LolB
VNWQQSRDQYALRLSGPLGIGTVLIDGNDAGVEIRNKEGVFQASSPEQLLLEMTGWQIPISALRYWARGLAAPDLAVDRQTVQQGRLQSLSQGGWDIHYQDYTLVQGLWLPAKMLMSRPETRLTLLYKNWHLTSPQ